MITPGNHDTLHHADTFELFTMSFYSPMWYEYYNYFYTLRIGNIVLLAYNPENTTLSKRGIDRFRTPLIDIFQK